MKATRVLAMTMMLGLCGVACESEKSSDKSSEKDDKEDKKKKKKKSDKDGDKKGGDKDAKKDGDAKDKPASDKPAPSATAKASAAASGDAAAEPAAKACGSLKDIPDIPAEKSDAPSSLDEWKKGCKVNTVGPNSEAPDCSIVVLRDWAKVTCRGDMLGYENFDGFGNEGADYFKSFTKGSLLSFVVRLRKGQSQKVRMCRPKERASLFISWPPGKNKPTIMALQRGPKCDKSALGRLT